MDDLQDIVDAQDQEIIEAGDTFKKKSKRVLHIVEVSMILWLVSKLVWRAGTVAATAADAALLASASDQFQKLLATSEYPEVVANLAAVVGRQPGHFAEILKASGIVIPVSREEAGLTEVAQEAIIRQLLMGPAEALRRKLFIFGSSLLTTSQTDLVSVVAGALEGVPGNLSVEAITAISTYYRSLAERGYAALQATQSELLRFRYVGPRDEKNRPFCLRMLVQVAEGRTWTRAEIDQMDNHQTGVGTVFTCAGGFACRHQFALAGGLHADHHHS